MCIGCNSKKDKKELIRIVRNNNGINVDKTGKQEGRGAYICNDIECLKKAIKSKRLERNLEIQVSEDIYNKLEEIINGGEFIG